MKLFMDKRRKERQGKMIIFQSREFLQIDTKIVQFFCFLVRGWENNLQICISMARFDFIKPSKGETRKSMNMFLKCLKINSMWCQHIIIAIFPHTFLFLVIHSVHNINQQLIPCTQYIPLEDALFKKVRVQLIEVKELGPLCYLLPVDMCQAYPEWQKGRMGSDEQV